MALALVNDPRVVFLDEPTTGLDPQARRNLWEVVRGIREQGKTVVLTTHYMEEAQVLCDRVAVMDHGNIIACDTPLDLIRSLRMDATVLAATEGDLGGALEDLPGVESVERQGRELRLRTGDTQATITALMMLAAERKVVLDNRSVQSANLEDVFISYTGRSLREQ
ncbi:MAG: AAA family ATPase [Rubrobacteraceae bacterium]